MTTPTPEEVAKLVKRLDRLIGIYERAGAEGADAVLLVKASRDMLEALSRARDAEWNAAIRATKKSIRSHSDTARKQLRACYEGDRLDEASTWSAIASHLDTERDRLRALLRPEGGSHE